MIHVQIPPLVATAPVLTSNYYQDLGSDYYQDIPAATIAPQSHDLTPDQLHKALAEFCCEASPQKYYSAGEKIVDLRNMTPSPLLTGNPSTVFVSPDGDCLVVLVKAPTDPDKYAVRVLENQYGVATNVHVLGCHHYGQLPLHLLIYSMRFDMAPELWAQFVRYAERFPQYREAATSVAPKPSVPEQEGPRQLELF